MSPKEQADHSIGLEPLQNKETEKQKHFPLRTGDNLFPSPHMKVQLLTLAGPSLNDVYSAHMSPVNTLARP